MFDLPAELAAALSEVTAGHTVAALGGATAQLIERYQADRPAPAAQPILGTAVQAAAYLLYRMPATYAAVRSALGQVPELDSSPRSQLDLGGGTGAAAWAATDRWPGLRDVTVLDNAAEPIELGRRLAAWSSHPALRAARWTRTPLGEGERAADPLPQAELVTISYLLSELDPAQRLRLLDAAERAAARLLVVVEPGTKAGYRRILDARDRLLASGWSLIAPCPHEQPCPMAPGDWCHFPARVNRSAAHRRLKQAEKSYEDEKFSYLVVSREPLRRVDNRIVRHLRHGQGRVQLTLCRTPPGIGTEVVGKRSGDLYRAARHVGWGDGWPGSGDRP